MWVKILTVLLAFHSIEAIFMLTLPTTDVEAEFKRLGEEKPYLMKSPNDASLSAVALVDVEKDLHQQPQDAKNLVDLAASLNLTVLVKALEETGLDQIIDHEGKYTLFAPTNEAFDHIPKWAEKIPLRELLKFHVARGLIHFESIKNDMLARTILAKRDVRFNIYKNNSVVTVNGAPMCHTDFTAHNGILHIIDRVLVSIPERHGSIVNELDRCPTFKTLSKLIGIGGLRDSLHGVGPFTLFAPTDEVFDALPADLVKHLVDNPPILRQVLLYHVAAGSWYSAGLESGVDLSSLQQSSLSINIKDGAVIVGGNATVTVPDATASNGVIHAIDSILLPPSLEKKLTKMIYKTGKRKLIGINGD